MNYKAFALLSVGLICVLSAWLVKLEQRPFATDLAGAEFVLSEVSMKIPRQSLSVTSDLVERAKQVRLPNQEAFVDPLSIDLQPPSRIDCRKLNLAAGSPEKLLAVRLMPERPAHCSQQEATWRLHLRGESESKKSVRLTPGQGIWIDLEYPGRPAVVFQELRASSVGAFGLRDEINPFGTFTVRGTDLDVAAKTIRMSSVRIELSQPPARVQNDTGPAPVDPHAVAVLMRLHASSYDRLQIDEDNTLWYWQLERFFRWLVFVSGTIFALLKIAESLEKLVKKSSKSEEADLCRQETL